MDATSKFKRMDEIGHAIRNLDQEINGDRFDNSWRRFGESFVQRGVHFVRGKRWHSLTFNVRDDYGKEWSFKIAISPSGRTVRIIDGKGSRGRLTWEE